MTMTTQHYVTISGRLLDMLLSRKGPDMPGAMEPTTSRRHLSPAERNPLLTLVWQRLEDKGVN